MAVQLVEEQNTYAAAFRDLMERRADDEPSWLRQLRESSFKQFESAGFPSVKQEDWKYTNVAAIARTKFAPVLTTNGTQLSKGKAMAPFTYKETRESTFVFVNGIFRQDLSARTALPENVLALELGEALRSVEYEATNR